MLPVKAMIYILRRWHRWWYSERNNDATDKLPRSEQLNKPINTPGVSRMGCISVTRLACTKDTIVRCREVASRKRKACIGRFYMQSESAVKRGARGWVGGSKGLPAISRPPPPPVLARPSLLPDVHSAAYVTSGTVERVACAWRRFSAVLKPV